MSELIFADTNIFIRYFTNDLPDQAEQCRKLFEEVACGKFELFICDLIVAEIVYVLENVYELNKSDITRKILAIDELDHIVFENQSVILEALNLYEEKNLDFTDAYLACLAKKARCTKICTFDEDFKKIDFVEKITP